jgi:signal transduction histidine kinase
MDDALRQSERRFRERSAELESVYETLPVGLAIHDGDLRVVRTNGRIDELWTGGGDRVLDEPNLRRVLETGEAVRDVEVTTPAGSTPRSLLCSFAPLRDVDGHVSGVSTVVQDITQRKHAEEALREADRQKDEFLAILGHELRNPLAAIRSAAELLHVIGHGRDARVEKVQSVLDRQTRQMTKLIDGLLDVTRIVRGKLELDNRVLDLGALLRHVVEDRCQQLAHSQLELVLEVPTAPIWVQGDAMRLVQIFDNLLSNAAKFTPAGGRIAIVAASKEDRILVQVHDDGLGIDAEALLFIFEPFRQAHDIERSRDGLGLGLSLVSGLVELHGGTIAATSDGPNMGSTFTIELPLAHESAPPLSAPPDTCAALRVVVLDDDVDMMQLLSELLTVSGHDVVGQATSGREGLELVGTLRPDVVLCDIGMPGELDGLALARLLRADPELERVQLIALTGYAQTDLRGQTEAAGFDAHVLKPVTLEALQRHLGAAARRLETPSSR